MEKPLKSQDDIVNERLKKMGLEEIKDKKEMPVEETRPLKSTKDIAMEKSDRIMAEAKANEDDAKKLKELEKKTGLNLSKSILEKENEAKVLAEQAGSGNNREKVGLGGMNIQEKISPDEELENLKLHKERQEDVKMGLDGMGGVVEGELERVNEKVINLESRRAKKISNKTGEQKKEADKPKEEVKGKDEVASEKVIKPEEAKKAEQQQEAPKAEIKINEKVQSEALKDFMHKSKRGFERPNMKDDAVMQAMEDFVESLEKKTPISETIKNFVGFLKSKKEKIPNLKYTKNSVINSMKEFVDSVKKIRKSEGKEGKPSNESARIDRIMRGDKRSDEAVRIDERMGKAMEKSREIKMTELLKVAETQEDLIKALDGMEVITDKNGKKYEATDQQAYIEKLFRSGNEYYLKYLTRGPGSEKDGIRANVSRVFRKIEADKVKAFDEEMKKGNEREEEFKQAA